MANIAILILSLGIVLVAAELFVNGIEWLGKKCNLSEGAVGSVLAAVGTALPETLIPIIAIVFGHGQEGHEIGIGAILGAPLMLATLAMFVTGFAVIVFKRVRTHGSRVIADFRTMSRDLGFFIVVYSLAVLTGFIPTSFRVIKIVIACLLVLGYIWYVDTLIRQGRNENTADDELPPCYFAYKNPAPTLYIILQVLVALGLIILGANLFVGSVKAIAAIYSVPAFILALIIAPVATELPEKFNSVIWISREKDTLALGNITGAMVFQSSLIPAIGIFLTDWQLTASAFIPALLALLSAGLIYFELKRKMYISAHILMAGGFFYLLFIIGVFNGYIH